jgi:hypothetical protein
MGGEAEGDETRREIMEDRDGRCDRQETGVGGDDEVRR